jgi:hypothetical protein
MNASEIATSSTARRQINARQVSSRRTPQTIVDDRRPS